ncbi:flagellar biosynthesis protein FlhA [Thermoleophilum album]|uniref:Flagellar biosynthesis protein FlhA n=1 Tax=Thermoleophilum album TaxID=29539 RepID=A0A1H6FUX9_THEAL|nr:flagellar biosynthesis protein FlhA [Thermoleophilum album]SEH14611.1 flagellar biosynthesis protein FlhA [Thermoleophilum album]
MSGRRNSGGSPAQGQQALARLARNTDLAAAAVVAVVVVMMVVPLPPALLDFLITLNISAGLAILVTTLYLRRPLEFAAFPSLLLLTTLFRLAINVSVTRQILLHADAGHVVRSFGEFVVGGNVVVGLVVFLILVVIQFVVVTNGAGRVAEVAARFTLDAMPGKQMAIDADLNAGLITDEEAKARRAEIAREADFYGAMDGASKFVKGDAIAAVLIVLINLVGGMVVGVVQHGLPFAEAAQRFSLLTVGDGLAAQIPALLISVATGVIVTRAASDRDLGRDVITQIARQRRAPLVAGGLVAAMALVPGLPKLPFLVIGGLLLAAGRALAQRPTEPAGEDRQASAAPQQSEQPSPRDAALQALELDPLELAVGFALVPLVDSRSGGTLLARIGVIRRQMAAELGIVIPPVRVRDDATLDSHEYVIRVRGSEVARGRLMPGHQLAIDTGEVAGEVAGVETREPAFGLPARWIEESARPHAEALGYTVVDAESVLATHLTEVVRRHAADLLTRQDVRLLLNQLKERNAAVVEEVVPDVLTVGEVQRVLQGLLREGVSIRDLGTILEAIGDRARINRDPAQLIEYARQALGRTIVEPYLDGDVLRAATLDPALEQELAEAVVQTADGELLALPPERTRALAERLRELVGERSEPRVLLCSSRVRRHVRRLAEAVAPQLAVCAFTELPPSVRVENVAVIGLPQSADGMETGVETTGAIGAR